MIDVYDLINYLSDEYSFDRDNDDVYDEIHDRMSNVIDKLEDEIEELVEDGVLMVRESDE